MVFTFDLGSGFFSADLFCNQIIPDKLETKKRIPLHRIAILFDAKIATNRFLLRRINDTFDANYAPNETLHPSKSPVACLYLG